jgi:hypothetical protein
MSKKLIWANEIIEELIELVESKEVIWNIKSKLYHDKDKRRDVVNEICNQLQISGKYW